MPHLSLPITDQGHGFTRSTRRESRFREGALIDVDEFESRVLHAVKESLAQFIFCEGFLVIDDGDFMIERVHFDDEVQHVGTRFALLEKSGHLPSTHVVDLPVNVA